MEDARGEGRGAGEGGGGGGDAIVKNGKAD